MEIRNLILLHDLKGFMFSPSKGKFESSIYSFKWMPKLAKKTSDGSK